MAKKLNLFGEELSNYTYGELDDSKYSQKVKTPVYTPRARTVSIYECCNSQKYLRMCRMIDKSNTSYEEKEFLKLAASRFLEFNYESIADYYASASKDTQEMFEKLALVIIDFDKAIENGFVQLNDKMRALYEQEID